MRLSAPLKTQYTNRTKVSIPLVLVIYRKEVVEGNTECQVLYNMTCWCQTASHMQECCEADLVSAIWVTSRTDGLTDRETDKQANRWKERKTDKQTAYNWRHKFHL